LRNQEQREKNYNEQDERDYPPHFVSPQEPKQTTGGGKSNFYVFDKRAQKCHNDQIIAS